MFVFFVFFPNRSINYEERTSKNRGTLESSNNSTVFDLEKNLFQQ